MIKRHPFAAAAETLRRIVGGRSSPEPQDNSEYFAKKRREFSEKASHIPAEDPGVAAANAARDHARDSAPHIF